MASSAPGYPLPSGNQNTNQAQQSYHVPPHLIGAPPSHYGGQYASSGQQTSLPQGEKGVFNPPGPTLMSNQPVAPPPGSYGAQPSYPFPGTVPGAQPSYPTSPGAQLSYPPPPGTVPGVHQSYPPPPGSVPGGQQPYPAPSGNFNMAGGPAMPSKAQMGGESDDEDENAPEQPSIPSAPALDDMDKINGYERVGFNGSLAPPPSYEQVLQDEASKVAPTISIEAPGINEKEAKEALLSFASEKCCYGTSAARNMTMKEFMHSNGYHYNMQSFTERRETAWAFDPYTGQQIDSPMNGMPPAPWDINVICPNPFNEGMAEIEIPHTASVKECHGCQGHGTVRCLKCRGRGRVRCSFCHGSGRRSSERCHSCHGSGRKTCYKCHGNGMIVCMVCLGAKNLKCYIRLTVTWIVHSDDHILERTALPDQLIKDVSGRVLMENSSFRVAPVTNFPESSINQASADLILKHSVSFPFEKTLMQKHQIRVVPVAEATYRFKNKEDTFFVYGFENEVYAPNYPQQCCWGCNLL